jgi:RND family efflux transporter MFP subunit
MHLKRKNLDTVVGIWQYTPMGIKKSTPLTAVVLAADAPPPKAPPGALTPATPYAGASAPRVPTLVVGTGEALAPHRPFEATLQATRQATLAAQVAGHVLDLAVRAGDAVRAGQVLVRIDDREASSGVAQRDAALAEAQATQRLARQQAQRTRDLQAQGFVSMAALDAAQSQLASADAGVRSAQAARAQASVAQGHAVLAAPFDAIVLATHMEAGDLATPGRPVITLHAPGALRAVAHVSSSRVAQLRADGAVQVELPDGRRVAPIAQRLLPLTDPVAQTVEWRLDLPRAATQGLQPGQAVRVLWLDAAARGAAPMRPVIPESAVLQRGDLSAVYVAHGDAFVLRPVRLGARSSAGVQVWAGLKPGERIATDAMRAGLNGARAP